MKNFLNIIKKGVNFALEPIKNKQFRLRMKYAYYYKYCKVDEKLILYEAYHGKSMTCNPYAIFKELLNNPNYKDYKHVWAFDSLESMNQPQAEQYKNLPNVEYVIINSNKYLKYLAKAKYLINNVSFKYYFQKKDEQIYINTWHGTPFKALGKDIKNAGFFDHTNVQRNFLHTDFLVVPNQYTFEKIMDSYDIRGIFNGYVVDCGYPRIDLTLKENSEELKEKLGIPKNKKIVLFAPTWRASTAYKEKDNSQEILEKYQALTSILPNDFLMLLKVHSLTYKHFLKNGLGDFCVPNWIDTNELLSIVDILITDYSSIFFDFLPTKRPIIFYMEDMQEYYEERGVYLEFTDLPGPVCFTPKEVVNEIIQVGRDSNEYQAQYEQAISKYCYNDDGKSTKRIVEIVFENNADGKNVYKVETKKTKLLMYCGAFITNGITTSAINLLNSIDYEKYDVTLLYGTTPTNEMVNNLRQLSPNVKLLQRIGTFNFTLSEYFKHKFVTHFGLDKKWMERFIPKALYKNELKRVAGNSKFDIAVDFSGYSEFWVFLMLYGDFKKRCIYLHNDMLSDSNRKVNGKYPFKRSFKSIFNLYKYFDKLVCVSSSSLETNAKNLNKYGISGKLVCVNNAINYDKVLQNVEDGEVYCYDSNEYLVTHESQQNGVVQFKGILLPNKENINFVSVGRLSPEKDHAKLIKAFSKITLFNPNVRLYIIGDGPLKNHLTNLIKKLGLTDKVFLTGKLSNPFKIVNLCDCFILSSNYEGQPLVLLEAMILRKPIIGTDVTGIRSVLREEYGELVENSEEGLIKGMLKFLRGEIKTGQFDYISYNKKAMDMFYKEVCQIDKVETI